MPYYSLTRRYDIIISHLKTGWTNIKGSAESEAPGHEIQQISDIIRYHTKDPHCHTRESRDALNSIFSFLASIKTDFDQFNWKIKDIPENALNTYHSDVSFYLAICYFLQKASSIWASFLPHHILPPAYVGSVNIDRSIFNKTLAGWSQFPDENMPDFDWQGSPIKNTISELAQAAEQYKGYQCIQQIISSLKNNMDENPPYSKADEQKIIQQLKNLIYKLKGTQSPCHTFTIIIEASLSGLIKPHDTENYLLKILSECHKSENPTYRLSQLKACIKRQINPNNPICYDNTQLQTNARESLLELKAKIKHAKQEAAPQTENQARLYWAKSKDEFLDLFCELIENKIICIPNQKDWHATINYISTLFLVPKDRGNEPLSVDSLAKYIRCKISGYY